MPARWSRRLARWAWDTLTGRRRRIRKATARAFRLKALELRARARRRKEAQERNTAANVAKHLRDE